MFENAGIKSKEEAKQRLDAGETFWVKRWEDMHEIKRDDSYITKGKSPYRIHIDALSEFWEFPTEWLVKVDWFKRIPDQGVMCWVRDFESEKPILAIVIGYVADNFYKFETQDDSFRFAIPATPEDTANLYLVQG